MTERAPDLQIEAFRAFTLLCAVLPSLRRQDWRGALILACGFGARGEALAIAASISGAGSLIIDPRPEIGRAAMRAGACDFVVNTVDEALRVLKNEIRLRRPIGVGLTMDATAALEELLDRGVLPELFAKSSMDCPEAIDEATQRFENLGTLIVDFNKSFPAVDDIIYASGQPETSVHDRGLRLGSFAFGSAAELRAFDNRLLEIIPATASRHRWCLGAPRFFHRERPFRRVLLLSDEERDRLTGG